MPAAFASRLSSTRPEVHPSVPAAPPIVRLRFVLLALLVIWAGSWILPRGRAAWQLHNRAALAADYSLCLVGPTGPEIVREGSSAWIDLLRLRILTAPPESQPFSSCDKLARELALAPRQLELLALRADDFADYFGEEEGPRASEITLPTEELTALAENAWPFVREGYLRLVQPSSHTKEAAHPTPIRPPGIGRGLPARPSLYRSTATFGDKVVVAFGSGIETSELVSLDGGVSFRRGSGSLTGELADRCAIDAEGRSYTVTSTDSGERYVVSHGPGAAPEAARLTSSKQKIVALTCDEGVLAALVTAGAEGALALRVCPYRRVCQEATLPSLGKREVRFPADIARVGGDLVLSTTRGGISRVTSSRDGGRTWTPWTVVFDRGSAGMDPAWRPPFRLLKMGDQVLLYGGAKGAEPYPLLISADHGATFRAPS